MKKYDISKINRVSQFFAMCLAGIEVDAQSLKEEVDPNSVMFHYMANGASDQLTVQNIRDFQDEVKKLNAGIKK